MIWFIWFVSFNKKPDRPNRPDRLNNSLLTLAEGFNSLLDVMVWLDRDGQAAPAQPGDIEGHYVKNLTLPGGREFEITLDTMH